MFTTAVLFALSQSEPTKTYKDKSLDLSFERPAGWEHKKTKYGERFEFAAADGTTAVVQLFKTKFRQPTEVWQELQTQVATHMGRKVARQWEEQILGVPLLMTRIEYEETSARKATVVGLLYTATSEKLNFRINASLDSIDGVESAWRAALLTLRTLSGELPQKDDPSKPIVVTTKNEKGQRVDRLRVEENKRLAKAPNSATIFSLGRKVAVTLPKNWTIEQNGDEAVLRVPTLSKPIDLIVVPGGAAQAESALADANSTTFGEFGLVTLRDETAWRRNLFGAQSITSVRIGKDTKDVPLSIVSVVGTKSGIVWLFQYSTADEKTYRREKAVIDDLVLHLTLEFEE